MAPGGCTSRPRRWPGIRAGPVAPPQRPPIDRVIRSTPRRRGSGGCAAWSRHGRRHGRRRGRRRGRGRGRRRGSVRRLAPRQGSLGGRFPRETRLQRPCARRVGGKRRGTRIPGDPGAASVRTGGRLPRLRKRKVVFAFARVQRAVSSRRHVGATSGIVAGRSHRRVARWWGPIPHRLPAPLAPKSWRHAIDRARERMAAGTHAHARGRAGWPDARVRGDEALQVAAFPRGSRRPRGHRRSPMAPSRCGW